MASKPKVKVRKVCQAHKSSGSNAGKGRVGAVCLLHFWRGARRIARGAATVHAQHSAQLGPAQLLHPHHPLPPTSAGLCRRARTNCWPSLTSNKGPSLRSHIPFRALSLLPTASIGILSYRPATIIILAFFRNRKHLQRSTVTPLHQHHSHSICRTLFVLLSAQNTAVQRPLTMQSRH